MIESAKVYVTWVLAAAAILFGAAAEDWKCNYPVEFLAFLGLALVAARVQFRISSAGAVWSASTVVLLAGIVRFSPGEAAVASGVVAMAEMAFEARRRRYKVAEILFHVANQTFCVSLSALVAGRLVAGPFAQYPQAVVAPVAALYFLIHTLLASQALSLFGRAPLGAAFHGWYGWPFPVFLVGAGFVPLLLRTPESASRSAGAAMWLTPLAALYLLHFFLGLHRGSAATSPPAAAAVAEARHTAARRIPVWSGVLIGLLATVASALVLVAAGRWESASLPRFAGVLLLAVLAAAFCQVRLPASDSTVSPLFAVTLFAAAILSFSEVMVIAFLAGVCQFWPRRGRTVAAPLTLLQIARSVVAASLAFAAFHYGRPFGTPYSFSLGLAAMAVFLVETGVAALISLLFQTTPWWTGWSAAGFWSFPCGMMSTATACLMLAAEPALGWAVALSVMPLLALAYFSCRVHFRQADGAGDPSGHPTPGARASCAAA